MDKYTIMLLIVLAILCALVAFCGYLQIKAMKRKEETNQTIFQMLQAFSVLLFFVIYGCLLLSMIHESTWRYLSEILEKLEVLAHG